MKSGGAAGPWASPDGGAAVWPRPTWWNVRGKSTCTPLPSNRGSFMFWTMFRTQRSASGGAPLTRTRLARPAGSASNDTATIGFCAEGVKQDASELMVPWIAEFSDSRLSPFGFPLSVPAPPEAAGFAAATGSGSGATVSACGPPPPKPFSLRGPASGAGPSWGTMPWGRGGGFPLVMPKASHPTLGNARATIRQSVIRLAAELCSDRMPMFLLYRKLACRA